MAVNTFDGSSSSAWNTAVNWSLNVVPTASDGHVTTFDATSPSCSMGGARSCNNIDFTGYTNTLTMSTSNLTVAGNVTLDTGMIISGTGTLIISATSTITSNGYDWPNNLILSNNNTKTLSGNLTVLGLITISSSTTLNKTTAETLTCSGGISLTQALSGSANVIINGGTWSAGVNGVITNNLTLSGTLTISGTVRFQTGTLTNSSATLTAGTSVLSLSNSCTLDTSGVSFYDVLCSSSSTYTINSLFSVSNLLNLAAGQVTFDGTAGFTCGTLQHTGVDARTISLKEALTYTVTSSLLAYNSRTGSIVLFTSSHASTKAILTLQNPAACNVLASFTRIDASAGRTIPTFNGTITDCLNIIEFHDLPTSSHAL